jgi:hypothetical protein
MIISDQVGALCTVIAPDLIPIAGFATRPHGESIIRTYERRVVIATHLGFQVIRYLMLERERRKDCVGVEGGVRRTRKVPHSTA